MANVLKEKYEVVRTVKILKFMNPVLFLCRQSQHHDDEKRALSREIIVLNNHLMEAKLTIEKLQEDNVCLCVFIVSSTEDKVICISSKLFPP